MMLRLRLRLTRRRQVVESSNLASDLTECETD
jgi:hypothetical protein